MYAGQGVSQSSTGTLAARNLRVLASNGDVSLANTGDSVGTLAAEVSGGKLSFANARALSVGQVATGSASGSSDSVRVDAGQPVTLLTGAGDIVLDGGLTVQGGVVTLDAAGGVSQSVGSNGLRAGALRVLAHGGGASLDNRNNAIRTVAAEVQGGDLAIRSKTTVSIGSVTTDLPWPLAAPAALPATAETSAWRRAAT